MALLEFELGMSGLSGRCNNYLTKRSNMFSTCLCNFRSSDPSSVLCLNDVPEQQPNNTEAIGPEVKHVYEVYVSRLPLILFCYLCYFH